MFPVLVAECSLFGHTGHTGGQVDGVSLELPCYHPSYIITSFLISFLISFIIRFIIRFIINNIMLNVDHVGAPVRVTLLSQPTVRRGSWGFRV